MRSSHYPIVTRAGVILGILASLAGASRHALAEPRFEVLKSFEEPSGDPSALVEGSDGAFYGTTRRGGSSGSGTVFRIDGAGTFASLHSFDGPDTPTASAALAVGSDGALYGNTVHVLSGLVGPHGKVFRIDGAGAFTSLHSFGYADGSLATLVLGSDCALYGTTLGEGGSVYRLFEAGHLCQRLRFDPLPDRTLGDPPFAVSATVSSGLLVSFQARGSCTVRGDEVFLTGAGRCTLTASQVGDASYEPAPELSQAFRVLSDDRDEIGDDEDGDKAPRHGRDERPTHGVGRGPHRHAGPHPQPVPHRGRHHPGDPN